MFRLFSKLQKFQRFPTFQKICNNTIQSVQFFKFLSFCAIFFPDPTSTWRLLFIHQESSLFMYTSKKKIVHVKSTKKRGGFLSPLHCPHDKMNSPNCNAWITKSRILFFCAMAKTFTAPKRNGNTHFSGHAYFPDESFRMAYKGSTFSQNFGNLFCSYALFLSSPVSVCEVARRQKSSTVRKVERT